MDRSDDFNRANGALGTPSDGGSAWVDAGGTGSISSNEFLGINLFTWTPAYLETSTTQGKISATVKALGNSGIGFRYVDSNNFWLVQIQSTGLGLYKRVAGTFTLYGSAYTGTISVNDVIEVEVTSGNVWTVKQNGTPRINPGTSDSAHNTATKLEMANYSGSARYDDMSFTDTASSGTTVNADLGTATASGFTAGINLNRTINSSLGTAVADGFTATISLGTTIAAALGTAVASGFDATISTGTTVAASLGTATASGFTATIWLGTTIAASLGTAVASGFDATILNGQVISASLGTAVADGFNASVSFSGYSYVTVYIWQRTA